MSYKTLIRPLLVYASVCWPISKKDGNILGIFKWGVLRMIYGPVNDNGIWRTRYSNVFYWLYNELDKVKVMTVGRPRWLGHLSRMRELDPCSRLNHLKTEETWHVGKPKLRCLGSVEEDLKNWRHGAKDSGGQVWKRLRCTEACNGRRRRRRRIVTDIYCSMVNILYVCQCFYRFRRQEKSG
jgi:hypothetical protein